MYPFVFNKENSFCISLFSHNNRWEKMQSRFSKLGLSVTRWKAAEANTSDIKDNFYHYLNPGQRACSQSHINLWRFIASEEYKKPYALILEDDACFDKDWKNKLDKFNKEIVDEDLDAIFLNVSEPINEQNKWTIAHEQYLTGGYIITKKGCENILTMFHDNYASSDWMTSRLQTLNHSYSYFPWLIIQEGAETTIGSNVTPDHEKVVRCLSEINYSLDNYIV
jgi:GR25 family glycosyltransferase involved in LPS biosynthesis